MAACDIPASIWYVVSIHNPEGTKSKVIYTTDPHRVALLAVGNERTVVHFQDNISRIVDVGEIGRDGVVVIDKVDITYGRSMDHGLGGPTKDSHREWGRAR